VNRRLIQIMIKSRVKEVNPRPKGCPFNIMLILSFKSLTLFSGVGFWTFAYSETKNNMKEMRCMLFFICLLSTMLYDIWHNVSTDPSSEKMQVDWWINPKTSIRSGTADPTFIQRTASNSALPVSSIVQTILSYSKKVKIKPPVNSTRVLLKDLPVSPGRESA
jgi:hypothetical protein